MHIFIIPTLHIESPYGTQLYDSFSVNRMISVETTPFLGERVN